MVCGASKTGGKDAHRFWRSAMKLSEYTPDFERHEKKKILLLFAKWQRAQMNTRASVSPADLFILK